LHPVGQKQPNAWGLYDMHGNVWELCLDYIDSYEEMEDTDPVGVIAERWGAMRGGGYLHEAQYCRAARSIVSTERFGVAGIRIAINP
jgi:formylglycine-generating enzyme required for sulfatase activity